jgi:ribosomal protein S18 acetylase RimI-like enzyme
MTSSNIDRIASDLPPSLDDRFAIVPFSLESEIDSVVRAWAEAFVDPPNGPRSASDLKQQLLRHSLCPGFVGFVARDHASGAIAGVTYGYSNAPGQWWRDRVAHALGKQQMALIHNSFCLTELGVIPSARRHGIANALVMALLRRQPHPLALLSTRSDNQGGLAFYQRTGWRVLLPYMSFGWNFPPYAILMHDAGPLVIDHILSR